MGKLNVIVFLGRMSTLTFFVDRFLDYAREHDIDCYVVDVNRPETYNSKEFDEFASRPDTVMFTFNNVGTLLENSNGENFWKAIGIPVFDYIVDHPRNFADLMYQLKCDLYVFALDKDHVEFINNYYRGVKKVYFSPNGGTEFLSDIPYEERTVDVIYMGSCQAQRDDFNVLSEFEDGGAQFYSLVVQMMIDDTMLSTEGAIKGVLKELKVDLDKESFYNLYMKCAANIEATVRRITKLSGIKALSDAGVHVDIYGENWIDEEYPFGDNIVIHERILVGDLMTILGNSKISLCFMPWFKQGCSEKNLDSMLNGAVCVTDKSRYLEQNYHDGDNIIYFDLNNPEQMAADVSWLLNNPDVAQKIAQKGLETARKYDTWNNRFEFVTEKMRECLK